MQPPTSRGSNQFSLVGITTIECNDRLKHEYIGRNATSHSSK